MSERIGIGQAERVPEASAYFPVHVVEGRPGEYPAMFRKEGPVEVWLAAHPKDRADPYMVIPVSFANFDNGNLAAQILTDALELVAELSAIPGPDQETCEHELQLMRFSRTRFARNICRKCLKDMGEVDTLAKAAS